MSSKTNNLYFPKKNAKNPEPEVPFFLRIFHKSSSTLKSFSLLIDVLHGAGDVIGEGCVGVHLGVAEAQ